MVIGFLQVELHYPGAESLKDKRQLLQSLLVRIRKRFNVSAAEVEYQNLWQKSVLAVAHVNTDRPSADAVLSAVLHLVETEAEIQMTGVQTEYL
jgi:uncharacterized protein